MNIWVFILLTSVILLISETVGERKWWKKQDIKSNLREKEKTKRKWSVLDIFK